MDIIYIDPPYNTGSDFVYKDDFAKEAEKYKRGSGQYDEEGNRLVQNVESNGRFHTDWLNMIYPRLKIARDLLSDDGVIFISIDDNEQANLKKICDEIFGEQNHIATFGWEKAQHFGRQTKNSYSNYEYIMCYARVLYKYDNNKRVKKELLVENIHSDLEDAPLYNASNNEHTISFPKGSVFFKIPDGTYQSTNSEDYRLMSPVIVKNHRNDNEFSLRFRSRWANNTVQEAVAEGTTFIVKTETFSIRAIYSDKKVTKVAPREFIFTNSNNPSRTISRVDEPIGTVENASSELTKLFNVEVFDYPKPSNLIEYLISLVYSEKTSDYNKSCLVLDFFSGSATTAQAIMQLNAKDGGKRKFILVQLPENLDKSSQNADGQSNATAINAISFLDSIGKPHTICELGKERIRRAGKKIKEESPLTTQHLDTGFRVLKLDSSNMKDVYYSADEYKQVSLLDYADNIKEDRTSLDLLFQVMLQLGHSLSAKIEEKMIANKQVFVVDDDDIIACFAADIDEEVITEIAKMHPLYAVFRDSSMQSDSARVNFEQIFAAYSPATDRRVI